MMLAKIQQQLIFELTQKKDCSTASHANSLALLSGHKLSPGEQLDIYHSSILTSLINSLNILYPVCAHLMGHKSFSQTAKRYIATHASYNPDLNLYGNEFASFIEKTVTANHLEFLADLAHLERSWNTVYDSLDEIVPPLAEQLSHFAESELSTLIFRLPTAAILLNFRYPVLAIWQAYQQTSHDIEAIDSNPGQYYFIIHRRGLNMRIDRLSDLEFKFLSLIKSGITLGEIIDMLNDSNEYFSLNTLLLNATQNGWILTIKEPQTRS